MLIFVFEVYFHSSPKGTHEISTPFALQVQHPPKGWHNRQKEQAVQQLWLFMLVLVLQPWETSFKDKIQSTKLKQFSLIDKSVTQQNLQKEKWNQKYNETTEDATPQTELGIVSVCVE